MTSKELVLRKAHPPGRLRRFLAAGRRLIRAALRRLPLRLPIGWTAGLQPVLVPVRSNPRRHFEPGP